MRIDCPDEPTPLEGGGVVAGGAEEPVPVKRVGVEEDDPGVETVEALFGVKPPGGVYTDEDGGGVIGGTPVGA